MINVKFLSTTRAKYNALTPVATSFYRVENADGTFDLYLGNVLLSNSQELLDHLFAKFIEYKPEEGTEGQPDYKAAVSVKDALDELYNAIGGGGSVADMIAEAINTLDADITERLKNKTDYSVTSSDGKALVFNESDGGGIKFENADGTWSFVGVNSGGKNGLTGQLYSVDHINENLGTRLNMTNNGFYYTSGKNNATFTADDEIATKKDVASASGTAESKTVYIVDDSAGQSDYAKVYRVYQGSNKSDPSSNTLIGTINIPLDKVLRAAALVGQDDQGHTGHFLKLEFQNVSTPIYVDLSVLADIYTGAPNASEVQITVTDYSISAEIVSVAGTKVVYKEVEDPETHEITKTSVTAALNDVYAQLANLASDIQTAINSLDSTVSQEAGTDGLSLQVVQENGVLTSITGSITQGTYDIAGSSAQVQSNLEEALSWQEV